MKSWCKLKDIYCSMANTNGYCQLTACMYLTDSMPVYNGESIATCKDGYIPIKGYIPIEWLKSKIDAILDNYPDGNKETEILCKLLYEWEKENEK